MAKWRTGSGAGGPCQRPGPRQAGAAGRGGAPAPRPHSPRVPSSFTTAWRRLRAASSLRLLGERATSGVPGNHALPRDPHSAADAAGRLPRTARAPSGQTEGQEGAGKGAGPRQARRIRALMLPREWTGEGDGGEEGRFKKKKKKKCKRVAHAQPWWHSGTLRAEFWEL